MKCSICNNDIEITKTNNEYTEKKKKIDAKLLAYIDKHFYKDEEQCWQIVMQAEALLLSPTDLVNTCINKKCIAQMCAYCYRKNIICLECGEESKRKYEKPTSIKK